MTQEQIIQLHEKKHVKIFLLSKQGLSKRDIAKLLGTNVGHVYNVLKEYDGNPEKAEKAAQINAQNV